jgi:hypothetical protein
MSSDVQLRRKEYHKPNKKKVTANTKAKNKEGYQTKEEKSINQLQKEKLITSYSKFIRNNEVEATNLTVGYEQMQDFNILNMDLLALVLFFIRNNTRIIEEKNEEKQVTMTKLDDLNSINFSNDVVFNYYSLIGIVILNNETDEKKIKYKSDFLRYLYLVFQFQGSR